MKRAIVEDIAVLEEMPIFKEESKSSLFFGDIVLCPNIGLDLLSVSLGSTAQLSVRNLVQLDVVPSNQSMLPELSGVS